MGEWKESKLGDVLNLKRGYDLPNQDRHLGTVPILSSSGIMDFHSEAKVEGPGVVTGRYGTIGQVFYTTKDYWPLNTTLYVQDFKGNHPKFIYYFLKGFDFAKYSDKSAVPGINRNDLHTEDVSLPNLPEQKAIAEVLSSLDDKIDLLHRQNKTLESLAETLFRQWFIEEASEGWKLGKVDDVVSIKGGTTPSTKNPEFWDGEIHWTTPRDLSAHSSVFLTKTERRITEEGLSRIGSGVLPIGTVLLSSRAPIGYIAIAEIPVAINQGYIAIVCDKGISNNYVYLWARANIETFKNAGNGSVFQEISKSTFRNLNILVPTTKLLMQFDEQATPIFEKIKSNVYQIRTLETTRDRLLPKLMSGDIVLDRHSMD